MTFSDSIKSAARDAKEFVLKHRKPIGYLIGFVVIVGIIWASAAGGASYLKDREKPTTSGFLDYMPDVPRPCPSDYRCGGISREQVRMENRLYADLREGSKYALPETMTSDAYDVIATEAEPTDCMLKRASAAKEAPPQEGQYTPWDEIEQGFLARKKKTPLTSGDAKTLA
jgi:hypothetical protein